MDSVELLINRVGVFVSTKRELAAARKKEEIHGPSMLLAEEIDKAVSAHRLASKKLVEAHDLLAHVRGKR